MLHALQEFASSLSTQFLHLGLAAEKQASPLECKIVQALIIPQAVVLPRMPPRVSFPSLHEFAGIPSSGPIVLLPAGIRPVKDVSFCIPSFLEYQRNCTDDTPISLVLVGPVLSEAEHKRVLWSDSTSHILKGHVYTSSDRSWDKSCPEKV
jgi:hypothetical protein